MASSRPPRGKLPSHRPLSRPEDRERPFANVRQGDPRLGPVARCLSRGGSRGRGGHLPPSRAAADSVAAREAALRRVQRIAEAHAEAKWSYSEVRSELVDALLRLRVLSLECVEAIERWRACNKGGTWPDPLTGESYVLKMKTDTLWLSDSPLGELLEFSPKSDPFFVVPSAAPRPQGQPSSMTPTLRAQTQRQRADPRRPALPLQASLLRRIREAELVILKESVHARIQQQSGQGLEARAARDPATAAAAGLTAAELAALAPRPGPSVSEAPLAAAPGAVPAVEGFISQEMAAQFGEQMLLGKPEATLSAPPPVVIGSPTQPLRPAIPDTPFALEPVGASAGDIQGIFERYVARVDTQLARTVDGWRTLGPALEDDGPSALEWFWLRRSGAAAGSEPEGLAVFRLKQMSTVFGQLLHVSVVDLEDLGDAVESVKTWMFAWLPIKSIRITLWYAQQETGEFMLVKPIEAKFKSKFFRWFQLTNVDGVRGQVMNRPRGTPEDGDPLMPAEAPAISLCCGQAWLRGAGAATARTRRLGGCAQGLALAGVCLHQLWKESPEKAAADQAAALVAAEAAKSRGAVREALVKALLSGDFDKNLARLQPVDAEVSDGASPEQESTGGAVALAARLCRSLETRKGGLPGVMVKFSADVPALLRSDAGEGFATAAAGLETEALPSQIEALRPADAAYGRLFVTLDWASCLQLDDGGLEIPVHAVGSCPGLIRQPILYLATTEDDTFVVVIPCGDAVPAADAVFPTCAEALRIAQPQDPPPYSAVKLSGVFVRQAARLTELVDPEALKVKGTTLHVAEFGSMMLRAGRELPGKLRRSATTGPSLLVVDRPYMVAIWHTDMDDLNVPLCATLVGAG